MAGSAEHPSISRPYRKTLMSSRGPGQVITFYSYKGGTGRTMALANVAYLLAQQAGGQKSILMVDWDLDAPGLHKYFLGHFSQHFASVADPGEAFEEHPGLIDLFLAIEKAIPSSIQPDLDQSEEEAFGVLQGIDLTRFAIPTDFTSLWMIKAGSNSADYAELVNTFPWEDLYRRCPALYKAFAEWLASRFDYVLIDSRTGLNDISGICTMLLPEKLVAVFTPNLQSIEGVLATLRKAAEYRRQSDDLRPFVILPLPSRIDEARIALRDAWRFGDSAQNLTGYQAEFTNLFHQVYNLDPKELDLTPYFDEIFIQHAPDFAYGEQIAAQVALSADRSSLVRAYGSFATVLTRREWPWEIVAPPAAERAETELRRRAERALTTLSPEDQKLGRRLLLRLVRVASSEEGGEDAPQRVWLSSLESSAKRVATLLADAQLIVLGTDEATGREYAELSNPNLLRNWPRLQTWLEEDREFLLWRQLFHSAYLAWERSKRKKDLLLRGSALAEARAQLKDRPEDFFSEEAVFIKEPGQRRRRSLVAAATLLGILLVLLLVVQWQRTLRLKEQALRFESWGLPQDLVDWTEQLEVLKLPSAVNRVDWLADAKALKRLDLSGTNVTDLDGLPSSLESLDLSATPVTDLQGLPSSLQSLNLSFTSIRNLGGVPQDLVTLSLSDTPLEDLTGLPANLETLALEAGRLESLDRLPRSLKILSLARFQGSQLPPLPPALRSLSLIGTKLRTLAGLPTTLDSLTLANNNDLRFESLPRGLLSLTVDVARTPINFADLPPVLRALELRRVPVRSSAGAPSALQKVILSETSVRDLSWLPESLRSLTLGQQEQEELRVFPGGLTALTLQWTRDPDLGSLPRSLQSLDLSFSSLGSLKGLPSDLETLTLDRTNLESLQPLPPRLRKLELRWTRVRRLSHLPATLESLDVSGCKDLMELGRLPDSLRHLNISQTRISSLDGLPSGLRSLDISESGVQDLRGLPRNLVSLHLNSRQLRGIQRLPPLIRELYVNDALSSRILEPPSKTGGSF
jgi:cellulose biosynthesis protein BcsQ